MLVADHAGSAIPQSLGDLGLGEADRARHIAVDLGSHSLGEELARRLGAQLIAQVYSRLVIDCNRDPAHPGSIVEQSDGTPIPGNCGLSTEARHARRTDILEPYQNSIAGILERRPQTILVSLHSFTPVMAGKERPWHIGVLHDGHRDEFAIGVLAALRARESLVIGDNEPYRMDATDYTVPRHAYPRGLPYAEIEVRQDLLSDDTGVARIAAILAEAFDAASAA